MGRNPEGRSDYDRLLLLMKTGDAEAFRQLYEQTAKSVYGYAMAIVKHPQEAEEVMQDTYLTVWNQVGSYHSDGKPMAWIFTIARNHCYMRLRRQASWPGISLEELTEQETGKEPGQLCEAIEQAPEKYVLLEALSSLKEEEREIVVLHDAGGLKHREIADNLGLPLPTILSKYRRALKKLEKVIDKNTLLRNNGVQ